MSSISLLEADVREVERAVTRPGFQAVARIERRKLAAQLPLRLLVVIAVLGPFVFAALLKIQSGTPSDALLGVWVHSSGFAVSLVVLGFAGTWGLPILAGVLAGDVFASEDRNGTWKMLLTRSRTLSDVFIGKVLAALMFAAGLALLVAVSSVLAGLFLVGGQPMVDLSGRELASGHVLWLLSLSWLTTLPPVLAYTSLALLFSVITRNGIVGVLAPILVALLTQLLALVGNGVWVHLLLVGTAFDAWHGLFLARPFFGPLAVSVLVCLTWIAVALGAAWLILRRREFIGPESRPGAWRRSLRLVMAGIAVVGLVALATNLGPAGVTQSRLSQAFAPEFRRLTGLQQSLLGHPIPATARYRILPVCGRRGGARVGPGDWSCTMNVYILLASGTQPLTDTPVTYDVSVQSNGCYKAQSPPQVVGATQIRDVTGHVVVNPIVTIYGCFNIL